MRYLKASLFLALTVFTTLAMAQEGHGEAHHETGIPKIVYYQALNFFGLLIIIYFILKSKVAGFFSKRREDLSRALGESRRLKEEAEKKHEEYSVKLQTLEKEAEASMERIRRDGEAAKQRIIEEAQRLAKNIEEEAKRAVKLEIERAKAKLYEDALSKSLEDAEGLLEKNTAAKDDTRLQKEFLSKIENMK